MATLSKTQRQNIKWGVRKLKKMAVDPTTNHAIIDIMAGKGQRQVQAGFCPTIAKSRGSSHAYWLTSQSRFLSTNEMAQLQGFKNLVFNPKIPKTKQGEMIGNAMSFPFLKWVLKHALQAADLM